jgi:hypothetical protein
LVSIRNLDERLIRVESVTESRMFAFEDLQVWQKAVDFADLLSDRIYRI